MDIRKDIRLNSLTTLGVGGLARYLVTIRQAGDIPPAVAFARERGLPFTVLGGGSNVVVSDAGYSGVVLLMRTRGIKVTATDAEHVIVEVAAGEDWDGFVAHCVAQGWWGVENLAFIPGSVGAVPVQNVGAYGQDVAQTLDAIVAWDTVRGDWVRIEGRDCRFAYRTSIFNTTEAGRYVIAACRFRLARRGVPNLSHAAVRATIARTGGLAARIGRVLRRRLPLWPPARPPSLRHLRAAVIALRTDGRLPDWHTVGNAGSFFKHATLDRPAFARLVGTVAATYGAAAAERIRDAGAQDADAARVGVPAGELVRLCGLGDARAGGAALHDRNPIVLVNREGRATAADIRALAFHLRDTVRACTGVTLDIEPQWIGFDTEGGVVL